jgi:NAD(P)-dependent dehydrogenase (short-subunit alcohol dehydrogenase family)
MVATPLLVSVVILVVILVLVVVISFTKKSNSVVHFIHHYSSSTSTPFSGKVILVTGGTSGIGLATALAFALENPKVVVVCGRQPQKWETAKHTIPPSLMPLFRFIQCDVRVASDVEKMIQSIVTQYNTLDVAFNNAGVAAGAPLSSQTLISSQNNSGLSYSLSGPQPWTTGNDGKGCSDPSETTPTSPFCENAIYTDGIGVLNCIQAELKVMIRQLPSADPPTIVNTASVNSFWGSPGAVLYGIAKSMVWNLTRGSAVETATMNGATKFPQLPIRINCIAPGAVYTPLLASQIKENATYDETNQAAKGGIPMGRIAYPEEITGAVLFLADNSRASYITGSTIVIDGGLTASPVLSS